MRRKIRVVRVCRGNSIEYNHTKRACIPYILIPHCFFNVFYMLRKIVHVSEGTYSVNWVSHRYNLYVQKLMILFFLKIRRLKLNFVF